MNRQVALWCVTYKYCAKSCKELLLVIHNTFLSVLNVYGNTVYIYLKCLFPLVAQRFPAENIFMMIWLRDLEQSCRLIFDFFLKVFVRYKQVSSLWAFFSLFLKSRHWVLPTELETCPYMTNFLASEPKIRLFYPE